MSDKYLKPCPFCDHEAVIDDCGDHRYFVHCTHCSINQDKLYAQRCDAIRAWNRRAKEPKKGQWDVEHGVFMYDDIYGDIYRCSVCGYRDRDPEGFNYCPHCGAKMEVEDE